MSVSANLYETYCKARPKVRRLINQFLFENLWVTTGLTKRPRVVGATVREPLMVLAQALPEHLRRESEAERPELLVFSGVGSNSDFLVRLMRPYSNPAVQEEIERLHGLLIHG